MVRRLATLGSHYPLNVRKRRQNSWGHLAEARTRTGSFRRSWSQRRIVAIAENNTGEAGGVEYLG